jgi:hypothetical protein
MSELREMVEMISGIPPAKQSLILGQKIMPRDGTLQGAGIGDGELLQVVPTSDPFAMAPDGSAVDPEAFIAALRQNPELLQRIGSSNPALNTAITSGDASQLQAELRRVCIQPYLSTYHSVEAHGNSEHYVFALK